MIGLESILGAYSSGSPLMGGLGGAAGGIMTGFAIGGPLGAAVGAGIFLASIISGIFGRRKKDQQAVDLVQNKYVPAIQQIVDSYSTFQMQYQDALAQLDQLQNQAKAELQQLGGAGTHVFLRDVPWRIDQARKEIQGWENDRQGRSAINFGAPLFDAGGYVGDGSHTLAVLRDDEIVMNPGATRRNRGQLERMNAGYDGEGDRPITIVAWDGASVASWLRNGGARQLRNALRGQDLEYSGEGIV